LQSLFEVLLKKKKQYKKGVKMTTLEKPLLSYFTVATCFTMFWTHSVWKWSH